MIPFAVQTYTIREAWKNDPALSLTRLKQLGVKRLELARVPFVPETARIVLASGLEVVSIQAKFKEWSHHFEPMLAFANAVGCKIAVVSVSSLASILFGKRAVLRYGKRLDELSFRFKKEGIVLALHHHDFEFRMTQGKTKLEWLLSTTKEVGFVSDTYWCKKAGFEPEAVARQIGDRLIGLHLRDFDVQNPDHPDTELGNGSIDFAGLLSNLPASVAYGAIEQNTLDPYGSLSQSIAHLQTITHQEAL